MSDEVTMVRIYLHESDQGRRKALVEEILNALHDRHRVKGATVFRGIAGFGGDGDVHAADMLRLNVDLPEVVEFFDEPGVVEEALRQLSPLVPDGHIVTWPAHCSPTSGGNRQEDPE